MKKILIAAPYYRCGSTLIQRCLHQCDDTIILGEMNGFFNVIDNIMYMATSGNKNPIEKQELQKNKYENWKLKIDDDYSLCYDKDFLINAANIFEGYVLSQCKSNNVGLKMIGLSHTNFQSALCLEYDILWVTRDLNDAQKSYDSQPWCHYSAFSTCVDRSQYIKEPFLNDMKIKYPKRKILQLDYKDIHSEIGNIIKDLELNISEEKLQSILNNKINSGY